MSRRRITADDLGPQARAQLDENAPEPSEEEEQRRLIAWADSLRAHVVVDWNDRSRSFTVGDYLLAIPNGGHRLKVVAAKLKAQGVRAGVPDLFLAVPRGGRHGLWIELKRRNSGRTTPQQAAWLARLSGAGYATLVAHGWRQAADQILAYLDQPEAEK